MCPCCGGWGELLGRLGRVLWLRCRKCGLDFKENGEELWDIDLVED